MQPKDWLTLSIAVYAAIVSTSALAWNIFIGWRDRARITLRLSFGQDSADAISATILGTARTAYLALNITNHGRRPMTFNDYGLIAGNGFIALLPTSGSDPNPTSFTLTEDTPEQVIKISLHNLSQYGVQLYNRFPDRAYVRTTAGKTYVAKLDQVMRQYIIDHTPKLKA